MSGERDALVDTIHGIELAQRLGLQFAYHHVQLCPTDDTYLVRVIWGNRDEGWYHDGPERVMTLAELNAPDFSDKFARYVLSASG